MNQPPPPERRGDLTMPSTDVGKATSKPDATPQSGAKVHDDLSGELRAGGQKYTGPPATVKAQWSLTSSQYTASVNVIAPTSGWTLALDRGEVVGDTARVYMTLERPAEDETVIQSSQTLTQAYTAATPFTRAAVYIHVAQRGVSTFTTNYRLAASSD